MKSKILKTGAVVVFGGLAAIPGLMYALAVKPVQDIENNPAASPARQIAVANDAASTGRLLFAIGGFLLLVLATYIVFGLYLGARNSQDLEGND